MEGRKARDFQTEEIYKDESGVFGGGPTWKLLKVKSRAMSRRSWEVLCRMVLGKDEIKKKKGVRKKAKLSWDRAQNRKIATNRLHFFHKLPVLIPIRAEPQHDFTQVRSMGLGFAVRTIRKSCYNMSFLMLGFIPG